MVALASFHAVISTLFLRDEIDHDLVQCWLLCVIIPEVVHGKDRSTTLYSVS